MTEIKIKKIILIVLVFVLAATVASLVWYSRRAKQGKPVANQAEVKYAPQGELSPGFDKKFIIGKYAKVDSSYTTKASSTGLQYTAIVISDMPLRAAYDAYRTLVYKNNWTLGDTILKEDMGSVYATDNGKSLNVTIVPNDKGSKITISYIGQ